LSYRKTSQYERLFLRCREFQFSGSTAEMQPPPWAAPTMHSMSKNLFSKKSFDHSVKKSLTDGPLLPYFGLKYI